MDGYLIRRSWLIRGAGWAERKKAIREQAKALSLLQFAPVLQSGAFRVEQVERLD